MRFQRRNPQSMLSYGPVDDGPQVLGGILVSLEPLGEHRLAAGLKLSANEFQTAQTLFSLPLSVLGPC